MENLNAEIEAQSNCLKRDCIDGFYSNCFEVLNKHVPQKLVR